MKKKIVTLLLVAAMTGTMVVGCGSKADDKNPIRRQNRRMIKRIQRKRKNWQMMNTSMYPRQIQ